MPTVNVATDWAGSIVWAQQQIQLETSTGLRGLLWLALVFFGIFPGIVAYMVWAERKVAARFQDRIGPDRVGPLGLRGGWPPGTGWTNWVASGSS